ncbi:MAG: AAA family ATPase [Succinivibrio sp.]|jgi:hypothetical protein|nr:AAA family ATPase [Succinivibrio sp.]
MSNNQFLRLSTGYNGYPELREDNRYYVDKTEFIKTVINYDCKVLLLTRPRRFGKSVFMSTLNAFLKIDSNKPGDTSFQNKIFKDTKIFQDKEFCNKYMGQSPVIFVSLKDVNGDNFEAAYERFASTVYKLAIKYNYLLNSNKLDEFDKEELSKLLNKSYLEQLKNQNSLKDSLSTLASALYKEYEKYPILIIDEYDVPLARASFHDSINSVLYKDKKDFVADYHKRMVTLMSDFLGILKDEDTLSKTIITGCLKVAKNDIFTGVNNFKVNTVISEKEDLTGCIGFTKEETYKFLKDYRMDNCAEKVKEYYDGYKFYDKEMFCPWDVVNFIEDNYEKNLNGTLDLSNIQSYWSGSTSSPAIYDYLGFLTDNDNQKMQDLVDGKTISFKLNDSMNYDCLSMHNSNDFWSLLLHTGYLTKDWEETAKLNKENTEDDIVVRIPNLGILKCFTDNIKSRFKNKIVPSSVAEALANNLFEGKAEIASDTIYNLLQNYISIRDNATKAPHENYYHGYLNGLFSNCSKKFFSEYHSNYESGDGYADIVFRNERDEVVIIEIKVCTISESKKAKAREALAQIEDKNYAKPYLENEDISSINAYGISFRNKECEVLCKKIK